VPRTQRAGAGRRRQSYHDPVSQAERVDVDEVELDDEERAWLAARLADYAELLAYLHEH
jgi:hypothetical protein